jgi:glycosyltransferase involved in cell wall biosynthesis
MVPTLEGAGIAPGRIHVVPNAWKPSVAFLPPDDAREQLGLDRSPVVGWVGRISAEKGPDLLVRAAAALDRPEVTYSVVGTGAARGSAIRLAGELGVAGQFRWHGRVEEAARLMRAFGVLALPSRTEGTPMVLFEATAAGVPVVGSAVGGVPDVLGDGANVVPPGRPEAFARAVRQLLDDADARSRAVERARERILADYGVEAWVQRHRDIYEAVRDTGSPSPPSPRSRTR